MNSKDNNKLLSIRFFYVSNFGQSFGTEWVWLKLDIKLRLEKNLGCEFSCHK